MLRTITTSPILNLCSGLILLTTSGYEIITTFDEKTVGLEHGILIYSIIHIIQTIPEILHGLSEIEESRELKLEK